MKKKVYKNDSKDIMFLICHTEKRLTLGGGKNLVIARTKFQLNNGIAVARNCLSCTAGGLLYTCRACAIICESISTNEVPFIGGHGHNASNSSSWASYSKVWHERIWRQPRNCLRSCSARHSNANGTQYRRLEKSWINDGLSLQPAIRLATRKRADTCYSEPYDMTDANLGSLESSYWWEKFPKLWIIVLLCFTAFLLCNMDRVNMSIAILPMSKEFNWDPATVGLIQSSFFWGYLLTQSIGGIWADKICGKLVLGFGVVWWPVATVLTPLAARIGLPFLLLMRAFLGIGEGVAMPAMNNIISKWVQVSERSRSLALVYSGMYLGSVAGLAFSPVLINNFGWSSVFYAFGSLGSLWFALWQSKAYSSPKEDPELQPEEKKLILEGSVAKEPVSTIPWKFILSKAPVWALIISHFCHNWGTFILLTWMPTYYNQGVWLGLSNTAGVLAGVFGTAVTGYILQQGRAVD